MKTVVHINLTDEQLVTFNCLLTGKSSKRKASRKDITSYVQGCIDAALVAGQLVSWSGKKPAKATMKATTEAYPPQSMIDAAKQKHGAGFNETGYIRACRMTLKRFTRSIGSERAADLLGSGS